MLSKRKSTINNISFGKGNFPSPKEESSKPFRDKIKIFPLKHDDFIPFTSDLIVPISSKNKVDPKEDINIYETLNPNEFVAFYRLSEDIHRNRIFNSRGLGFFPDFREMDLYTSQLVHLLIIYIEQFKLKIILFIVL